MIIIVADATGLAITLRAWNRRKFVLAQSAHILLGTSFLS